MLKKLKGVLMTLMWVLLFQWMLSSYAVDYVQSHALNVREKWWENSKVIDVINKWDEVQVLWSWPSWRKKVSYNNGKTGFVYWKYVSSLNPYAPYTNPKDAILYQVKWTKYAVNAFRANVRAEWLRKVIAYLRKWEVVDVANDDIYKNYRIKVIISNSYDPRYNWREWYVAKHLLTIVPWTEYTKYEPTVDGTGLDDIEDTSDLSVIDDWSEDEETGDLESLLNSLDDEELEDNETLGWEEEWDDVLDSLFGDFEEWETDTTTDTSDSSSTESDSSDTTTDDTEDDVEEEIDLNSLFGDF